MQAGINLLFNHHKHYPLSKKISYIIAYLFLVLLNIFLIIGLKKKSNITLFSDDLTYFGKVKIS